MKKRLLTRGLAGAIIIMVAALALGTCGDESKDVGRIVGPVDADGYTAVYGYTYLAGSDPPEIVLDVDVDWYCDTCSGQWLGSDAVDYQGRYDIVVDDWSGHNGHTLRGVATKPDYSAPPQYINNFRWEAKPYQRNFYLSPTRK